MKPVNTIILVLLAAGLFAFIYFFESRWHPPAPVMARVLPRLNAAQVNSLSIVPQGESEILVERTNGVWRMIKPQTNRLREDVVDKFLRTLETLTAQTRISAEELHNRPDPITEYGFGKPHYIIVVQQGTEKPLQLNLGGLTPQRDAIYAQVVGFDYVDLVPADFLNSLPQIGDDWRDPTFAPFERLEFDRVRVTSDGEPYELLRDPATKVWSVGGAFPARADNAQVNKSLKELVALRAVRFVADDAPANPVALGLRPPRLEISFFNGGTNAALSLEVGGSPATEPGLVYARAGESNGVVLLPRQALADWRAGPDGFREKHLLSSEDVLLRLPDTFVISGQGQPPFKVEMRINGNIANPPLVQVAEGTNIYPGDFDTLRFLVRVLAEMQIVRQDNQLQQNKTQQNQAPYGLGTNPVRRYLLVHTPAFDTNATGTNITAQVDFGVAANEIVYARRSDLSNELGYVYAVKKEHFNLLPATALDFRAHRIWNFSVSNVTSVSFRAGGRIQKWTHPKPFVWKPENLNGFVNEQMGLSRESVVDNLGGLTAGRWVERTPADKARYGITDTSSQIKVETKEGDVVRTRTLDLGGVSPSGQRYGLVTMEDDGKEWVFEFPPPTDQQNHYDLKALQQYFQLPDPF